MSQTTVQYVLSRLRQLGITDIFGVPGDFSFPGNDQICEDKELRFIGSCNELNAAYAAEGYPRVKGLAASIQLTAPVSSMPSAASPEPMRASAGLPSCRAIEPGHAASSRSGA